MDLREVAAAYQSVYDINEEVLEENIDIDDLSQEDVDELVEELVYEFLEEGYSIEDIEESFNESIEEEFLVEEVEEEEELLSEARRAKRQPGASQGPKQKRKSLMQSQREKLAAQKAKSETRKGAAMIVRPSSELATTPKKSKGGAIVKSKGSALAKKASGAISKAVEKVKVSVDKKDTKSLPKGVKGGAIVKRNETIGAKTTPKQQAVAKAKETVKKGVGYSLKKRDMKRGHRRTVLDPSKKTKIDKLKDKASSVRVDVTNAAKGLKRKAGKALGKLASKLSEEGGQLDSFDTVIAYLIDEGIASDFDDATAKMAKLSEATVAKIHSSQLQLLDEAVYGGGKKEEKKDTRMTVTNADKMGNTKAYQNYMKGDKRYKAADHMKGGK